jgi:hypothetical protein
MGGFRGLLCDELRGPGSRMSSAIPATLESGHDTLAMQKVVGSSPIIRLLKEPRRGAFSFLGGMSPVSGRLSGSSAQDVD